MAARVVPTLRVTKFERIVEESIDIPEVVLVVVSDLAPVPPVILILKEADRPIVVATELPEAPANTIEGFTTTVNTYVAVAPAESVAVTVSK